MGNTVLYAGLALVGLLFIVALGVLAIVVIVKLFGGKGKAKAANVIASAPLIAPAAPSFLDTLKGGTAGAHAKINDACEDHAVSETLKHLFVATKHLVKDEPVATPTPAPASVPNSPPV